MRRTVAMKKAKGASGRRPGEGRQPAPRKPGTQLQYKVVELSTVDEGTLEHAINAWSRKGWHLDGVQFAMRESSKRPSMAFVFFTRDAPEAAEPEEQVPPPAVHAPPTDLPRVWEADPWARLRRLADESGNDDDEGGAA